VALSFGDWTKLPSSDGVSHPAVTFAGDIHVELTVGEGDIQPAHQPTVTVDVDDDDDVCRVSAGPGRNPPSSGSLTSGWRWVGGVALRRQGDTVTNGNIEISGWSQLSSTSSEA